MLKLLLLQLLLLYTSEGQSAYAVDALSKKLIGERGTEFGGNGMSSSMITHKSATLEKQMKLFSKMVDYLAGNVLVSFLFMA